ncbi:MAG: PAS domain S-box protein [Chthonomonadales bacterium]|nr:PAS domain S-box protein [Chthonomonadales bacterium]
MPSVQRRIMLLLTVLVAAFVVGLVIWQAGLRRQNAVLSAMERRERVRALDALIELQSAPARNLVGDYTQWDAMVAFIRRPTDRWKAKNLEPALTTFGVSGAWVYDLRGRLIAGSVQRGAEGLRELPLPPLALNAMRQCALGRHRFFQQTPAGVVELWGEGVHATADHARAGRHRGFFVAGRLWDSARLRRLADAGRCRVHLALPSEPPPRPPRDGFTHAIGLADPDGRPLGRIDLSGHLPLVTQARRAGAQATLLLLAFALLTPGLVSACLIRWVSRPLRTLSRAIEREDTPAVSGLASNRSEFGEIARMLEAFFGQRAELRAEVSARADAETRLSREVALLQAIAEALPAPLFHTDAEGRCVECNPAFLELCGLERAQALGRRFEELFPCDARAIHGTVDEAILRTCQPRCYLCELTAGNGARHTMLVHKAALRDAEGLPAGVLAILSDITEQQATAEDLERHAAYLRCVIDVQRLLLAPLDGEGRLQGTLARLGEAAGASRVYLYGHRRDDEGRLLASREGVWTAPGVAPGSPEALPAEAAYSSAWPTWEAPLSAGNHVHGLAEGMPEPERSALLARGARAVLVLPLVFHRELVGFVGFENCAAACEWEPAEVDLLQAASAALSLYHARKAAEASVRWNAALLRTMSEAAPLALYVVDNRSDRVLYHNRRFLVVWGIEHMADELAAGTARNADLLASSLPAVADGQAFAEACIPLREEANRAVIDDEIRFADGRIVRRYSTQIRDDADAYLGRFYMFEDITLRRRAEEALQQAHDVLEARVAARTLDLARANRSLQAEVAERRHAEGAVRSLNVELRRRLERLDSLRHVDAAISGGLDLRLTLRVLLNQVMARLGVDGAAVLLLDAHTRSLRETCARGTVPAGRQQGAESLHGTSAGQAVLLRRPVVSPAAGSAEGQAPMVHRCAPLIAKGDVKGVLEVYHAASFTPDDEWEGFLEALASQAAIAIDNSALFEQLQRSNAELTMAYDATIEGWSRALDLRDRETEGHTRRVTELTVALARAVGLPDADLVHIRRGALLHDIGKMGVPDSILLKPGPLTDEEWVTMRRHTAYACEMLSPIVFLRPALEIPRCHHERWDGAGYPCGLREEQIPIAARLFAVADIWDALSFDRPYRKAWPAELVREHLRGLSGTHLDPTAVDAFLRLDDTLTSCRLERAA